jgi:Ca2+-transporting ATPase
MPADEVVAALGTHTRDGLADAEAARRLARDGPNLLPEGAHRGPLLILLAQFADFTVAVLAAAAILAGALGEPGDMVAILAILAINAVLGFVQEYRAERAVAALKDLAAPRARVRRDGATRTVAAALLVSGDLVRLEAGDMVAADLRLVEAADLRVAEAALTGESEAVGKQVAPVPGSARLGDRRGMAYKGTVVASGRGLGVVTATGMRTELGRIATLLAEVEVPRTPLQQRLARFTRRLALAVLAICAVLFTAGLLRGEPAGLMLLTALSLAVAAIPEALPAVVTVALALGARRAAVRHALIRRLPAVETLGSVTYICSDKTGTLTENRMRVVAVRTAASRDADLPITGELPRDLLLALALSNDADVAADGTCAGDPTEVALLEAARSAGVEKSLASQALPRVAELPFTSARGRMTTVHAGPGRVVAFTKGAPEVVIDRCVRVADGPALDGVIGESRAVLHAAADRLAAEGMRVLAIAMRELPSLPSPLVAAEVEAELTFLGLVGLLDPPRADAAAAVAECRRAGIKVVMVTGDHPATARAIAARLGIVDGVHARVTPEEKIAIVEALQARGEFVAMTGDGVNDAPALKRANIGIAMGRAGTDVAREASDLILLDDHFATIVSAVREGRRIYDNIRKFVRYALTCNSAEIWTLVLAPLIGLPIPLLPIHLLWINLVTDGLPGVALGVEPGERSLMQRPPRAPDESILGRGLWQHAVWVGLLMGGATLATQAWTWSRDAQGAWQTMTFTVLAFLQVGHLLAIRSEREAFHVGFWRNPALLGAVALTVALQLAALYLPVLNRLLRTQPLTMRELGFCALVSTAGFVAVELEKAAIRRGWLWRERGVDAPGAAAPEVG